MAVPAHKPESKANREDRVQDDARTEQAEIIATADDLSIAPVVSPAKDLQDKLDAHFLPMSKKMSARFVTLLVMFTCVGTWISGVGLYGTLQAV
jgi:hypothetical protein